MFSQASVILFTEGGGVSVPAGTTGHMTRGVCVQGGLCPKGSLSRGVSVWGVSVRDPPYEWAVRILLECILVLNVNILSYLWLFLESTFNNQSL